MGMGSGQRSRRAAAQGRTGARAFALALGVTSLAAVGGVVGLSSPVGREATRHFVERRLREHVSFASVGQLEGWVPFAISMQNVRMADATQRARLHASHVSLQLDPWALLRGDLRVRELKVEGLRAAVSSRTTLETLYRWLCARGEAAAEVDRAGLDVHIDRIAVRQASLEVGAQRVLRDVMFEAQARFEAQGTRSVELEAFSGKADHKGAHFGVSMLGGGALTQPGGRPELDATLRAQVLDVTRDASIQATLRAHGALPLLDLDLRLGSGAGGALWLAGFVKLPFRGEPVAYGMSLNTAGLDPREFLPGLPRGELNLRVDLDGVNAPFSRGAQLRLDLALRPSALPGLRIVGAHARVQAEGPDWTLTAAEARLKGVRMWLRGHGTRSHLEGELEARAIENAAALGPLHVSGTLHAKVHAPLPGLSRQGPLRVTADAQIARLRYRGTRIRHARVSLQAGFQSPLQTSTDQDGELFVQTGAFRLNGKRVQPLRVAVKAREGQVHTDASSDDGRDAALPPELFPWASEPVPEALSRRERGAR
jgi:hypothetical protein